MKSKGLFAPFAMSCVVAALMGCASTERRVTVSAAEDRNLEPSETPATAEVAPLGILYERAFQRMDLDTNGVVTLNEWQHFDPTAAAKEHFNALDENGDGQINTPEFLRQAPKYSKPYSFFGDTNVPNQCDFPRDSESAQPVGLQIFSIRF